MRRPVTIRGAGNRARRRGAGVPRGASGRGSAHVRSVDEGAAAPIPKMR